MGGGGGTERKEKRKLAEGVRRQKTMQGPVRQFSHKFLMGLHLFIY